MGELGRIGKRNSRSLKIPPVRPSIDGLKRVLSRKEYSPQTLNLP